MTLMIMITTTMMMNIVKTMVTLTMLLVMTTTMMLIKMMTMVTMLMVILTIDGITGVCLSKRTEIREEQLKLCQVGPWGESMRMLKNKNIVLNIHQKTWGFVIFSNTFSWRWARQRRWCWTVSPLLLLRCHVWVTFFFIWVTFLVIFCLGNLFLSFLLNIS